MFLRLPRGFADKVVLEHVVSAPHRHSDTVFVVLEGVVGYVGVEALHHRHSRIAVVVHVVA